MGIGGRLLSTLVFLALLSSPLMGPPATLRVRFTGLSAQIVTLDGITLDISGSFIPGTFYATAGTNAIQVASAGALGPFRDLSVVAMPFGTSPSTEALPPSTDGGAAADLSALKQFRNSQTGVAPREGPLASLFGTEQPALVSQPRLILDGRGPVPVNIAEWAGQAANRLWLVRASAESTDSTSNEAFLNLVSDVTVALDPVQPSSAATGSGEPAATSPQLSALQPLILPPIILLGRFGKSFVIM